jgi:lipoyl synthase
VAGLISRDNNLDQNNSTLRRPHWLKVKLPSGANFYQVNKLVKDKKLHTVCASARCPNIGECWGNRTATFMIMGDVCSRNCGFCAVSAGKTTPLDPNEPQSIADAAKDLDLRYAVITSVTRDDLPDGGAAHFAKTVKALREKNPGCKVEVLIPDFNGDTSALKTVLISKPDVLNHNIETIPRLYSKVRPQAIYERSLLLLSNAYQLGALTKSGIMVGLGEELNEIIQTMQNLVDANCKMLTIGQYLAPSKKHYPVQRFWDPEEFKELKQIALKIGFLKVEAAPLVRSSYHADEQFSKKN